MTSRRRPRASTSDAKRGSSRSDSTIAGASPRSRIVSKSGTGEIRASASAAASTTASTSAADSVPETITVSTARSPRWACASATAASASPTRGDRSASSVAWKRTSSFAT